MINPFVKKKRNAYIGWNIGIYFLIEGFVYMLVIALIATLAGPRYSDAFFYLGYFICNTLAAFAYFGIHSMLNSSSKKAGHPDAIIPLAYVVIVKAICFIVFSIFYTPVITLSLELLNNGSTEASQHALFSAAFSIASSVISTIAIIVVSIFLFKSDDNRNNAIKEKVMTAKSVGEDVKHNTSLFSANRNIIQSVFVVGFILFNVLNYIVSEFCDSSLAAILKIPLTVVFVGIVAAVVIVINNVSKKNKQPEAALPTAVFLIPFGSSLISNPVSNLYTFIARISELTKHHSSNLYDDYSFTPAFISKTSSINGVITFVVAIVFIAVFTILVFKHEDKRMQTLFESGYFE